MDFEDILGQVMAVLERRGRMTHRGIKRLLNLDDALFEDVKEEVIYGVRVATEEDGRVLVWTGMPRVAAPDAAPAEQAERRLLTIIFCDLVGSTALSAQLDPEDLSTVLRRYQAVCTASIKQYDGHVAQYLGDGVMVYYGYPHAHEDGATRAALTGLSIVANLEKANDTFERELGVRVAVRIGMHTGMVVVGEVGEGVGRQQLALGEAPNLAARVQGLAEPDQVLMTEATRKLVSPEIDVADLGQRSLKGMPEPVRVFRVLGEQRSEPPISPWGRTTMIGRHRDFESVLEQWHLACTGVSQIALVSGEPGIGKSCFVRSVMDRITASGAGKSITIHCSAHRINSPFFPVLSCFKRLLRLDDFDSNAGKIEAIERLLERLDLDTQNGVPLLAHALSVPTPSQYPKLTLAPQRRRWETSRLLVECLLRHSRRQPLLLVWEDLHWADPSTLELLDELLTRADNAPLLDIVTFRPPYRHRQPWETRPSVRSIVLGRLPVEDARAIAMQLVGARPLPPELFDQILSRTDGVPLFVEEITKLLIESVEGGEREDRLDIDGIQIPMSLRDSLMARIDRLREARSIAQLGAVIGREFSYEVIREVFEGSEELLRSGLRRLVDSWLLFQSGSPPTSTYVFKHALVQEVAYQSLVRGARRAYHASIAAVLRERMSDDAPAELIAHHLSEAGHSEEALPYWLEAGTAAEARSAYREAVAHLRRGLTELKGVGARPQRDEWELSLQICYGRALTAIQGYSAAQVRAAYARARELCSHGRERSKLFAVLHGLWRSSLLRAEYKACCGIAEQLMKLATDEGNAELELVSHRCFSAAFLYMGEHERSLTHARKGLEIFEASLGGKKGVSLSVEQVVDPVIATRSYLAWNLCMAGEVGEARAEMQAAIVQAMQSDHAFSRAMALSFAAWLYQYIDDIDECQSSAERALVIAQGGELEMWVGWNEIMLGWVDAWRGEPERGARRIQAGMARWHATGSELGRSFFLTLLAQVQHVLGRSEDALLSLDEAHEHSARTYERWWQPESARLRAEILRTLGRAKEADKALASGLAQARRQGAILLVRRLEGVQRR